MWREGKVPQDLSSQTPSHLPLTLVLRLRVEAKLLATRVKLLIRHVELLGIESEVHGVVH